MRATSLTGVCIGLMLFWVVCSPPPAQAIEAGINIDVHQDIALGPAPNGFRLTGRLESGPPIWEPGGGNWSYPPTLIDHVDGIPPNVFPNFTCTFAPDMADPGQNWFNFQCDWTLNVGDPGWGYCTVTHLGVLFDLNCHNVVIDVVGTWTLDGNPIGIGMNMGFVPVPGFRVQDMEVPQLIHMQNGNVNGMPEPGEIEAQVIQMDVLSVSSREELEILLGPEPFRELWSGGGGGGGGALPWVRVFQAGAPVGPGNPWYFDVDSFFDVFLEGSGSPLYPEFPVPVQPGGFLIARELIRFINNNGMTDARWVWEYHQAHEADLGDAPDSTNSWGLGMTTYPWVTPANFPTVYRMGSPPHGPIHWQPLAAAFLGPWVSLEDEADLLPDQDGLTNIDPSLNAADQDGFDDGVLNMPLALPHCQWTTFNFLVTTVNPVDPMYVNVWFDWNRDADWDDILDCGIGPADEWAVQNMQLFGLLPNVTYVFATPQFLPWNPQGPEEPIWMRITLSDQPRQPTAPLPGYGGDGPVAGYRYGETEDYYFYPAAGQLDGCCLSDGSCVDVPPDQCLMMLGVPQGQPCTGTVEACCLPDMACVMVDPLCCDDMGGIALGPGTQCTAPEACCSTDASTCLMADPLCCLAALGIPQGPGTVCTEPQACCLPDHTCADVDPLCCDELGGTPQGDGQLCNMTPVPTIPCCLPDGTCVDTHPLCCDELGGFPGYATVCLGDNNGNNIDDACEEPVDGCCLPDGTCVNLPPDECMLLMGVPQGQLCVGIPEACCLPDLSCVMVDPICCDDLGGINMGPDRSCTALEACCLPDGTCVMADPLCCAAELGITQGSGTICTGPQACCLGDGSCVETDPLCCDELGGTPQGDGTLCVTTGPGTIPCCLPDGTCIDTHPLCCDELGGYPGYATICLGDNNGNNIDDACEAPTMACCLPNGACVDLSHNDCVAAGGDPQGPGTDCSAMVCTPLKWAQPPLFNPFTPHPECFWGWDEISIFGSLQIAADDFLCADDRPITDVHWWGSYRGWDGIEPPPDAPPQFHIGIWTDVPAGPTGEYSHPGVLIWQSIVDRSSLNERPVACDFHPGYMELPEGCFRYDFQIPENEWFYQPSEGNVLWISISAIYTVQSPPNPWGWKTREHFYNDDAVVIWQPTAPTIGAPFISGAPIWVGWDLSFVLTTQPKVQAKWSQPPHALSEGFDAPSDLWIAPPVVNKVEQLPNPEWPGLHAHDYEFQPGIVTQIQLADNWVCDGGDVVAFEWWGNYETAAGGVEQRGSGIAYFHLSVHHSIAGLPWSLPMDPEYLGIDVPFLALVEEDTGLVNIEGGRIYRYAFTLPEPFIQELGTEYWFDIEVHSNNPADPAIWRWQEARRDVAPPLEGAPAVERSYQQGTLPGPWTWIEWPPIPPSNEPRYSDMAFRVVSMGSGQQPVNKVVADDFISDGRRIHTVRWWGSYFDERYMPGSGIDPLHVLDGWLISFHHADPAIDPTCPPDLLAGDPAPTVLGVYFAGPEAVAIVPTGLVDCFGHAIYLYTVDLHKCCLVCYEADPRTGDIPALPEAFHEHHGFGYWLDIQAVTGARWVPISTAECVWEYTGHLPSDQTEDGHFWGWHTSPIAQLQEACTGQVLIPPIPPFSDCWNYGNWAKQPWLCMSPQVDPVHMAFELLTRDIRGDCTNDGVVGLSDHAVLVQCITGPDAGPIGAGCACVDLDVDDDVDLYDFSEFQVIFEGP